MPPLSPFRTLLRGKPSIADKHPLSPPLNHLSETSRLEAGGPHTPDLSGISLSRRYAQMARDLRQSIPFACNWLDPEDIKFLGERQLGVGGFANVWEVTYNGRKVVLKSYRCYISFDVAQVVARFRNEVHAHALLHKDVDVVPFVGVYSTEAHPFGLIYEYMDGLDLKQYLTNQPNMERVKVLMGIARHLNRMHDLDIVHEDLRMSNILVDKDGTPRIAGLGNAFILPQGKMSTDRLSRSRAPELAGLGASSNLANPTHPTKASDMYAFGVMAFEILTGQPPFSEMSEIAATYSMLSGNRPLRSDHHGIPVRLWHMIEQCWHSVPSKRMSIREALDLLETES